MGLKFQHVWDTDSKTRDNRILASVLFQGTCEFLANVFLTIGYQNAIFGGMNPGIVVAVVSCNTVYVLIASYILFNERLLPLQFIGACAMIAAVVMVSVYRNEESGLMDQFKFDDSNRWRRTVALIGGAGSALFYGSQIIAFKWTTKHSKDHV